MSEQRSPRVRLPSEANPLRHPISFVRWEWTHNRADLVGALAFGALSSAFLWVNLIGYARPSPPWFDGEEVILWYLVVTLPVVGTSIYVGLRQNPSPFPAHWLMTLVLGLVALPFGFAPDAEMPWYIAFWMIPLLFGVMLLLGAITAGLIIWPIDIIRVSLPRAISTRGREGVSSMAFALWWLLIPAMSIIGGIAVDTEGVGRFAWGNVLAAIFFVDNGGWQTNDRTLHIIAAVLFWLWLGCLAVGVVGASLVSRRRRDQPHPDRAR